MGGTRQRLRRRRSRATWPAAMLPGLLVLAVLGTAGGGSTAGGGVSSTSGRDVEMVVSSVER